jgi:ribonuclease BN (tRNA processing enzyme)
LEVKIIGCHGGVTKNYHATSILIDEKLLIDAGSVAQALDIVDQLKINHILISHAHLDHVKDLGFICDNCFGLRKMPFKVHCHKTVGTAIKDHIFNEVIWPDFSKLPTEKDPTIVFNYIPAEKELVLGEYKVMPVHVNHNGDAMGFIVEKDDIAIAFTLDTGPTERFWEVCKKYKNLKAIFTEISFPNKLHNVAEISFHHSPKSFEEEIKKMPADIPVYVGHLKPNYQEELIQEITALKNDRIHIMYADDVRYRFD